MAARRELCAELSKTLHRSDSAHPSEQAAKYARYSVCLPRQYCEYRHEQTVDALMELR